MRLSVLTLRKINEWILKIKWFFLKKLIFTELQLFLLLEIKIKITEMPKVLRVVHKNPLKCACPRLHGAESVSLVLHAVLCVGITHEAPGALHGYCKMISRPICFLSTAKVVICGCLSFMVTGPGHLFFLSIFFFFFYSFFSSCSIMQMCDKDRPRIKTV